MKQTSLFTFQTRDSRPVCGLSLGNDAHHTPLMSIERAFESRYVIITQGEHMAVSRGANNLYSGTSRAQPLGHRAEATLHAVAAAHRRAVHLHAWDAGRCPRSGLLRVRDERIRVGWSRQRSQG